MREASAILGGAVEGMRPTWVDYDGDGWSDLFSVNPVILHRNRGGVRFENMTAQVGLARKGVRAWAYAWGDVDNDGDLDLFLGGFNAQNLRLLRQEQGRFVETPQMWGDFDDDEGWVVDAAFGDLDNDGDLDLVLLTERSLVIYVNHAGRLQRQDAQTRVWHGGRFASVLLLDYDRDMRLDIAFTGKSQIKLLRNTGTVGHALEIVLQGVRSNTLGIGALIRVSMADGRRIARPFPGHPTSNRSAGCGPVHVGLGRQDIAELTVYWPSGIVQNFTASVSDKPLRIQESAVPANAPSPQ
jgi:hypothetical protein